MNEAQKKELEKMKATWNKERPWMSPGLPYWQRANMIGEQIYPKIHEMWKAEMNELPSFVTAGKITGMLVELPYKEADLLIGDDDAMREKYEQAKGVLIKYHKEGFTANK